VALTGFEAWGLGFLTTFLNTLFGEAIKDRLKPKSSSEKARAAAFYLYELLDELNASSDAFVSALRYYVNSVKTSSARPHAMQPDFEEFTRRHHDSDEAREWPYHARPYHARPYDALNTAASSLSGTLGEVPGALEAVNPQLKIFNNELVQSLEFYVATRAHVLNELLEFQVSRYFDHELPSKPEALESLQQLQRTAENNQQIIEKAIQDMRDFLAKEFTFKESF
jgi:hypothetical protein